MVFTADEPDYLRSQQLARLATRSADGQPDVVPVPVAFEFDGEGAGRGDVVSRPADGPPALTRPPVRLVLCVSAGLHRYPSAP